MVNFFGRRKSPPRPHPSTAAPAGQSALAQIAKMKETSNNLEKREMFLVHKVDSELRNAVQRKKKGDMTGAKMHLKRKIMYQKQILTLSNSRMNLETQILTIEAATVAGATVDAMRDGVQVMNRLVRKNNPDDIAETMDQIAEGNAMAEELGQVLGTPLDLTDDFALEEELGMLDSVPTDGQEFGEEDEYSLLEELPPVPTSSKRNSKRRSRKKSADPFANVPKVPSKKPTAASLEDEEINRLLVEMG
jgi:charged multivesicular body protein 4